MRSVQPGGRAGFSIIDEKCTAGRAGREVERTLAKCCSAPVHAPVDVTVMATLPSYSRQAQSRCMQGSENVSAERNV